MSQPYDLRVVLEKTPNTLLQKYFARFPAFTDLDWRGLAENDTAPVLDRLKQSDEKRRRRAGVVFRQAHALANPQGTAVLAAAARDYRFDISNQLAALKNSHERAFWCLVHYPKLFDTPRVYALTYSLPKTSRETRIAFPGGAVVINQDSMRALVQQIKSAYREERRAQVCRLDHREQDGVHLFHAYPSDYADEVDSYLPSGELSRVKIQPPFHIVYYLDTTAGTVTVLAKGGSNKHEALFQGFAAAVLHSPAPAKPAQKTYDLSLFRNANLLLKTDPAHHMRPLRVIGMRLEFPESPEHQAQFEVSAEDRRDDIYKLLQEKLRGGLMELSRSTVLSVTLQAIFAAPGQREEEIVFRITTPRWCTLEHEGKEALLRKYLRAWGIELDGKRMAALSKAAFLG